ncbi:MAG TPA: hypothetical protein VNJ12_06470 [Candidatus Dormibacteraeota bacterium]|nr:hypothetical protein [Candidatus Dormibacteraeota bacterium]
MKCVLLGTLICLSCAGHAQDQGRVFLPPAAECLAAKGFLPQTKATKLTFGYLLDEKSYPGKKMLYVVDYPDPSRPDGLVFTIFLTERDGRQNFNIQNNARFRLSKDADKGVFFVSPPLGGTWTREHLVSAIKKIEKQPRVTLSMKNLLAVDSSVSCEAYTDSQPKPATK